MENSCLCNSYINLPCGILVRGILCPTGYLLITYINEKKNENKLYFTVCADVDGVLKSSAQIFSGRVIGENQLPVEYATVALLSVPDSALVGGAVTDSKGVFKITAQDAGPYLLSVSFVGYKKFVQRVASSVEEISR